MHACMRVCKQLPSNQSFDKKISSHQKGGGVSRWGEWVGKATAYMYHILALHCLATKYLVTRKRCVWIAMEYKQLNHPTWWALHHVLSASHVGWFNYYMCVHACAYMCGMGVAAQTRPPFRAPSLNHLYPDSP